MSKNTKVNHDGRSSNCTELRPDFNTDRTLHLTLIKHMCEALELGSLLGWRHCVGHMLAKIMEVVRKAVEIVLRQASLQPSSLQ